MCQNYPNCNCTSCTQCQDCTQVTPTCVTTITTSCTTEQFTEECPNGLQSTDCLVYTGDTLKDCENNDFIFRGTKFNTFLSQLWETVKCAATATTDTIEYDGANIRNCDNTATVVATGSSLTTALNNIWNAVKCWYTDLSVLISQRQPVWQGSTVIRVGVSQPAPFNNLETALTELSKYHFNENDVFIRLEDGTYTLTSSFRWSRLLNERNSLYIDSLSGNRDNVIIKSSANIHGWSGASFLRFKDLTLHSDNDQPIINVRANGAQVVLTNVKITNSTVSKYLFAASDGSSIHLLGGCSFIDSSSANIGFSVFVNERNSNILIETASFTLNRPFLSSRSAQMRLAGVTINYTNPLSASLFVITGNSTLTLTQSTAVNTNPNAFESYFIFSDQSNFYISNNYSTSTNVVSGFAYGFVVYNGSNGVIYNTNKNAKYFTKVLCSNGNSKFHMNNGDVKSYNYNVGSMGIYSEMGESSLHSVSIETSKFYQAFNGGKGQFINNEILFNSTFATANPTLDNSVMVWEDGGNSSQWYNCNFNLNNSSLGTRTAVNGTQFWNSSTFTNVPSTARLRSDFNSSVYAPLVTGIIKEASSDSYIW
jgi:hypothetical protein